MSGVVSAISTAAAVVSAGSSIAGMFGGKPKAPMLPAPVVPAAPAPTSRTDTGANVVVGSDNVKNQRVGNGSNPVRTAGASVADVLGGLGGGGINI